MNSSLCVRLFPTQVLLRLCCVPSRSSQNQINRAGFYSRHVLPLVFAKHREQGYQKHGVFQHYGDFFGIFSPVTPGVAATSFHSERQETSPFY